MAKGLGLGFRPHQHFDSEPERSSLEGFQARQEHCARSCEPRGLSQLKVSPAFTPSDQILRISCDMVKLL
jgi:hypothetical protein